MSKLEERKVNWAKWRHIPELKCWQAVALSLDIDPDKVRHHPQSWMAGTALFQEGKDFEDRLDILCANHGRPSGPRSIDGRWGESHDTVELTDFTRWACSPELAWNVPDELRQFAAAVDAGATPATAEHSRPDSDAELATKERNNLLKIIFVLSEIAKMAELPPHTAGQAVESRAGSLGLSISEKSAAEKIQQARDLFGKDGKVSRKIPR